MSVAEQQIPSPGALLLDHVGHFVPDLDAAGAAWESLGFKVTERSNHQVDGKPGGTANRVVFFEQGYVEMIAPTLDTEVARRVRARIDKFIGAHLVAFGTQDAEAEHRRLSGQGFAPEPLVNLGRTLDDGKPVRFSVVRVPPVEMPEGRVQYCQHLTPQNMWRPGYINPLSLAGVFVVADDPSATAARWGRFSGLLPRRDGDLVRLETSRGYVAIGTKSVLGKLLGEAPPAPALAGYALGCSQPAALLARCRNAGLAVSGNAVKLPRSLGGVWVIG